MNKTYIYTDEKTINFVNNDVEKIILIGSDFGYSNFGDILQLKGSIDFHKKNTNLQPILVFHIPVISNKNFIQTMRKMYGVEGILFVTYAPLSFDNIDFELKLLEQTNNINALHMFGGGFLNSYWGNFVLDIVEDFIDAFKIDNYIISGQQIEKSFAERVKEHIEICKPMIIGARDFDSKHYLENIGVNCYYSFDDAVEKLLDIVRKVPKNDSNCVFGHINISSYTDGDVMLNTIIDNFRILKKKFPNHSLNLINAFNDKRHIVRDTLVSLVQSEYTFPYDCYSIINGSNLAYQGSIDDMSLLNAKIAISSSYHVTMLMHFLGTPCWLISNNEYYDQKRNALEIHGSIEDFLDVPYIPSYDKKFHYRKEWNALLLEVCNKFNKNIKQKHTLSYNDGKKESFRFKTDEIASIYDLWGQQEKSINLENLLALEKEKIGRLEHSRSWKITAPLRRLRELIKR